FAGMIYKVNPDTGQRALWTRDPRLATGGFPPLGASGLAFDPSGAYLYVANPGDSAILRIGMRPNGSPGDVEVFARGATDADPELLHGAAGLAFDVTGQLWVAADQANEIQVISPAGALLRRRGPRARHRPGAIGQALAPFRLDEPGRVHRAGDLLEREGEGASHHDRFRPEHAVQEVVPLERGPVAVGMARPGGLVRLLEVRLFGGRPMHETHVARGPKTRRAGERLEVGEPAIDHRPLGPARQR